MRNLCLLLGTLSILISCNTYTEPDFEWQGHRGARGAYPENTIPAFIYALDEGMNTLEMDVVITADKNVVVSHEPFFNPEICNANFLPSSSADSLGVGNNIYHWTYDDVSHVDCGSLPNPRFPHQKKMTVVKPLLSGVIDSVKAYVRANKLPKPNYNIEIKSRPEWDGVYHPEVEEYADLLMEVLKDKRIHKRTVVQSFDKRALQYLHKEYPKMKLALLVEDEVPVEQHIEELGFVPEVYSCYYPLVDNKLVRYCHDKEIRVIPWTVNSIEEISKLKVTGVDGVITDYPQLKREMSTSESD